MTVATRKPTRAPVRSGPHPPVRSGPRPPARGGGRPLGRSQTRGDTAVRDGSGGSAATDRASGGATATGARTPAAQRAYERRLDRSTRWRPAASAEPTPVARVPFVVLVIGLLAAGLVTTLWLSSSSAQASYAIGAAQERNQQLSEQAEGLRRDVAAKGSASALADQAAALGMVPAGDVAHLVVGADGAVTVVGVPKAASGTPAPSLIDAATSLDPGAAGAPRTPAAVVAPVTKPGTQPAGKPATKPGAAARTSGAGGAVGIQPGSEPAANAGGA